MVVGGRHSVDFKEGKKLEVIFFRIAKSLPESFNIMQRGSKRLGAKGIDFSKEAGDFGFGLSERDFSEIPLFCQMAGGLEQGLDFLAKFNRPSDFRGFGEWG